MQKYLSLSVSLSFFHSFTPFLSSGFRRFFFFSFLGYLFLSLRLVSAFLVALSSRPLDFWLRDRSSKLIKQAVEGKIPFDRVVLYDKWDVEDDKKF